MDTSIDKNLEKKELLPISSNIISFFILDKKTSEIKSFANINPLDLGENKKLLKNVLSKLIKDNYANSTNQSYYFRIIYLSTITIQAMISNHSKNIYVCIFNKKEGILPSKLFLLHISICYRNIYLKLCKNLENNEKLFSLIFIQIFFIPLMHNFDRAFKKLKRKIDVILFGNSEYITSFIVDLSQHEIVYDIGNLFNKNYKSAFLQFIDKKDILEEISFHGINLKNNYLKSNDKKTDKFDNSLKIELRATFPKPIFIIKFFPILNGIVIVYLFNQYKLSKTQIQNPNNPNGFIYDNYKEVDIAFFNLLEKLENNNLEQVSIIEKFFFDYFLILENNCKDTGNISSNLMTYKSRDFDLIYLNKDILKLIKEIIMEYYKDEKDLIYKVKRKFFEENEKENNNKNENENKKMLIIETSISKSEIENTQNNNDDNIDDNNKNPLELTYKNFIKEFGNIKINNSESVSVNDVNIVVPGDLSNVNEYSELNLSKDNMGIINRNIVTNRNTTRKDSIEYNIYNNNDIITTDIKNDKTDTDNAGIPFNTNEPFNIDITSIPNKIEISKDEWAVRSMLSDKNKK